MINGLRFSVEEGERVQAALENADAVMLGYMQRMRASLAGATVGIATLNTALAGLGRAFAALKPAVEDERCDQ